MESNMADDPETYSEEETVARRERAIHRLLNTKPKPHKMIAPGKPTKPSK